MNVTALSASPAANLQSVLQDRSQDYNNLQAALQSGNISQAQSAFAAFQQQAQKTAQLGGSSSLFSSGTQVNRDLQALGGALKSADLIGAQKAFMTLTQDITNASRSSQVISNHALTHPTSASQGARAFGANSSNAAASAQSAGSVLNQQA